MKAEDLVKGEFYIYIDNNGYRCKNIYRYEGYGNSVYGAYYIFVLIIPSAEAYRSDDQVGIKRNFTAAFVAAITELKNFKNEN